MYKKILSASLVAVAVMFSGCGNDNTTCRIDIQKAIDEGRYDSAISDLQGKCATAYTQSDLDMNLAAAYMGKSGYSVSDIADMLINSADNRDAFTSFLTSVEAKKRGNSLPLLSKANGYFLNAIQAGGNASAIKLCSMANLDAKDDSRLTNACLYIGFNETIKAANTITYLTGNVDTLVNSIDSKSGDTPDDMRASLEALVWATTSGYSDSNITATDINISGNPFTALNITYNENGATKVFYRLAKNSQQDANNTTIITDGYCDENGSKTACTDIENSDGSINMSDSAAANCYACPVLIDKNTTMGIAQLLVDTINNGADTISAVAGNDDVASSIADFKEEITNSRDGNVTIQNIIDYLQK
ncbi:hypothetical protein [Sulfurimonas sp.]|uniref:hypothetical protein n=1 Tax=Sulfurimonas sp. TaxID=2022749 RepID=UPI00261F3043|nr:hypothetical protein [Sulfurimonas sp.]